MAVTPEKNEAMASNTADTTSRANDFRTDSQYEEEYLRDTLAVVQSNSAEYMESTEKLKKDIIQMTEQYREGETEIWVPLNNAIAMYEQSFSAYSRSEKARKKPYFGRIIFTEKDNGETGGKSGEGRGAGVPESLYIGRSGISRSTTDQVVIDWRAPISNVYYENGLGECSFKAPDGKKITLDLSLKRTFDIEDAKLTGYFDSSVAANDELLNKYLARSKQTVLGEIIATIQKEQNDIIRRDPFRNVIVQGAAGSGKTTVAMHRISYILYNFLDDIRPSDFYIIGSNDMLLNYITGVLPELDVEGFRQMTLEQLFVRLLYEEWDTYRYGLRKIDPDDPTAAWRGTTEWYDSLCTFCAEYERAYFSRFTDHDIILNPACFVEGVTDGVSGVYNRSGADAPYGTLTDDMKTDPKRPPVCFMKAEYISGFLKDNPSMSLRSKVIELNGRMAENMEQELLLHEVRYTLKEKKAIRSAFTNFFGSAANNFDIYRIYADFIEYMKKSATGRENGRRELAARLTFGVCMKSHDALPYAGKSMGGSKNAAAELRSGINIGHGFFSDDNVSESLRKREEKRKKLGNREITGLDVYEMAALAYIYKQIREEEVISEAHHIVIDEAQDYGMMAYRVLNRCIRECAYTVMGDISQNIRYDSGLNDWSELRELLLTRKNDAFCTLRKSYRNTIEISEFATKILDHGSFEVYPVDPIIRHGKEPFIREVSEDSAADEIAKICRDWHADGLETIAAVTRTAEEAADLRKKLAREKLFDKRTGEIRLIDTDSDTAEFGNGVMVLPVEMTKGLEFDCVLIYEPTVENYPNDDRHAKLLYVAATRAMHELGLIISGGSLTGLVAEPAPNNGKHRMIADAAAGSETQETEDTPFNYEAEEELVKQKIMMQASARTEKLLSNDKDKAACTAGKKALRGGEGLGTSSGGNGKAGHPGHAGRGPETPQGSNLTDSGVSSFARAAGPGELTPPGHAIESHAVKWVMKQKDGIYFQSRCGVLRVAPISSAIARISYTPGMSLKLEGKPVFRQYGMMKNYVYREKGPIVEIGCGRLSVCVDKGNGAITFRDLKGRELLREAQREPRYADPAGRIFNYYSVNASEPFYAYPGGGSEGPVTFKYIRGTAYDITPDNGDPALFFLRGRCGVAVDSEGRTLLCHNPGKGTFTVMEGNSSDVYVIACGDDEELMNMYKKLKGEKENGQ